MVGASIFHFKLYKKKKVLEFFFLKNKFPHTHTHIGNILLETHISLEKHTNTHLLFIVMTFLVRECYGSPKISIKFVKIRQNSLKFTPEECYDKVLNEEFYFAK